MGQVYNTTIAYALEALSTSQVDFGYHYQIYTAINYTLLQYPARTTFYVRNHTYTYTPQILFSLPAELSLVDPTWESGLPTEYEAFDPPTALGSALALVSLGSSAEASPVAAPGPSIIPVHVPATQTPEPKGPRRNAPQMAQPELGILDSHLVSNSDPAPAWIDPGTRLNFIERTLAPASALVSLGSSAQAPPVAVPGLSIAPPQAPAAPKSEFKGPGRNPHELGQPGLVPSDSHLASNSDQAPTSIDPDSPDPKVTTPTLQASDQQESAVSRTDSVVGSAAPIWPLPQDVSGDNAPGAPSNPDATNRASSGGEYPGHPRGNKTDAGHGSGPESSSDLPSAVPLQPLPSAGNVPPAGENQAQTDEAGGLAIGSNRGDNVAGLTIPAGSKSTIAGHVISAFTSSGAVYGSIYALPFSGGAGLQPSVPLSSPLLIAGESVVRASGGDIIIGSSTIEPGSLVTISGHSVSAGHSDVLIDGNTYTLPSSVGAAIHQYSDLLAITPASGGIISAGGAPITLSGNVYSILSGGSRDLVVNGLAVTIPKTAQSVFQMDGQTYTAVPTGFAISGQTITVRGAAVTIGGALLSLGPSGLQIGSSTISLNAEQTGQANLGNLMIPGLGGAPNAPSGAANGSGVMHFIGEGSNSANKSLIEIRIAVLYLVGMAIGITGYAL